MTAAPIPATVRALLPLCGSPIDGEALGACRGIGRKLAAAGTDWHGLAAAIPTAAPAPVGARPPTWDSAVWRRAAQPAPAYRPARRKPAAFTPLQSANHRRMATYCRNADGGRLSDRERAFVAEVSTTRRTLSIKQADWLVAITDRLDMEDRGL